MKKEIENLKTEMTKNEEDLKMTKMKVNDLKRQLEEEKKEKAAAKMVSRYFQQKLIEKGEEKEEITREGERLFNLMMNNDLF